MAQPTITNFFSKRKRTDTFDSKSSTKVLVLEQEEFKTKAVYSPQNDDIAKHLGDGERELNALGSKVVFRSKLSSSLEVASSTLNFTNNVIKHCTLTDTSIKPNSKKIPAIKNESIRAKSKSNPKKLPVKKDKSLPDIRKTFLNQSVKFELKGSLSPNKNKIVSHAASTLQAEPKCKAVVGLENVELSSPTETVELSSPTKTIDRPMEMPEKLNMDLNIAALAGPNCSTGDSQVVQTVNARKELGLMAPKRCVDNNKELSLKEIKLRLTRSAKLAELRESLAKINKGNEKLKDIEQRKTKLEAEIPKLGMFKTIDMEVKSPMKEFRSPQKSSSPLASPVKAPAYQRFSSLAVAGTPTLILPFKHRCLAEVFRCVDTVVALFHNRKEIITFKKLKPAVQQMLRRNFMESHLGQIKRVFPSAFSFNQEKCHSFGTSSKADTYELRITPLIDSFLTEEEAKASEAPPMMPSTLLERRKTFTDNLTERVKDLHDEFLQNLDPPLTIQRDRLTRWHPEFDIDEVPEVEPESMPLLPNGDHCSTASDVLAKAKNLFSCNERMEKALQKVSELSMENAANAATSSGNKPKVTTPVKASVSAALKGIPKALLEKVRANQAARALVVMSRSAAQDKQGIQHSRLPELARIIRNLYVAEKRGILPLDIAVEKMGNSFREKLSSTEFEEHLQLIIKSVPGWLEIHVVRRCKFLKLSKNADMMKVMKTLEALSAEKNLVSY